MTNVTIDKISIDFIFETRIGCQNFKALVKTEMIRILMTAKLRIVIESYEIAVHFLQNTLFPTCDRKLKISQKSPITTII